MNKADKALADVRGWLCDNMSAGDAGKGCGMLSVVSRHITELEDENAKLRELLADTLIDPRDYCAKYGIDYDGLDSANDDIDRRLRELGIEVK